MFRQKLVTVRSIIWSSSLKKNSENWILYPILILILGPNIRNIDWDFPHRMPDVPPPVTFVGLMAPFPSKLLSVGWFFHQRLTNVIMQLHKLPDWSSSAQTGIDQMATKFFIHILSNWRICIEKGRVYATDLKLGQGTFLNKFYKTPINITIRTCMLFWT